ncbi:Astacin-like metalloprotease toxin 1 [Colletotrichum tanaceti]|uniref:Metalloendopeptidase n=1 Tax=Colletotrichum tanaceti TaxID=1306861 RepID=A0A4U6XKU2_9PEZI|nr:Astacin-like metalloprotease toxin 1 [Colletotrichum tanaceti]TKW56215.1 Astacin-like metalloprotease toxin 1 [Colletotrichum tanaceti]
MAFMTLKAFVAVALALSQTALAGSFPASVLQRSETEGMPVEKRGSMSPYQLWDKGVIPYTLEKLPHDLSNMIRDAMHEWETGTCIRFIQKTDQPAWITFKKYDEGCYAQRLGAISKGELQVNFDYPSAWRELFSLGFYKSCARPRTAVQALGHVIGLINEHQRKDRDQFVEIRTENVKEEFLNQFDIYEEADISLPFDYNSVMMYDRRAFSKTNWKWWFIGYKGLEKTMKSKTAAKIDPRRTPTLGDYNAVNEAYNCPAPYRRPVPKCRPAKVAADPDYSTYNFTIDTFTEDYMRKHGYTFVAAHQRCHAKDATQKTDNWGFAPLYSSGPDAQYNITVDRCKKRYGRHASRYEVALCRGPHERTCEIKCGLRRVCPFTGGEHDSVPAQDDAADPAVKDDEGVPALNSTDSALNATDPAQNDSMPADDDDTDPGEDEMAAAAENKDEKDDEEEEDWGVQVDSKAVDVVDDALWVCHGH